MRTPIRRTLAVASSLAVLALAMFAAQAGAAPQLTVKIDSSAAFTTKGKVFLASGSLNCPSGDVVRLVGAVIQRTSGAFATGIYPAKDASRVTCSGGTDRWTMSLANKQAKPFKPGGAEVCVIGLTNARRVGTTNMIQSCSAVKVVKGK